MYDDLVYITIGSNIDPRIHVPETIATIAAHPDLSAESASSFYASAPIGRPEQPEYRNGVIAVRTDVAPQALKYDILREIEKQHGRVRTEDKFAPRTIDLDIVLYKNRIIQSDDLEIPDSAIQHYPFVTIPLLEIAPDIRIPGMDAPLASCISDINADGLTVDTELTELIQKGLADGHTTG